MTQAYLPLGEQLALQLRRDVIEGRVPSGSPLTEDGVASRFGVSRGPVRDAFRALVSEGLLELEGRRVTARALAVDDVLELCALREFLETTSLRTALERRRTQLAAMLDAAMREMEPAARAQDTAAFTEADLAFHHCFLRAAGLRRVDAVWQQLRPTLHLLLTISNEAAPDTVASHALHRELADRIRSGEPEDAIAELRWHLANTRDNLLLPFVQRGAEGGAVLPTE